MPRLGQWVGREQDVCQQRVQSNPLKPLPPYIEVTHEPDILFFDDDETELRAKMPCGHVMGREGMTMFARSTVVQDGLFVFTCPDKDCTKIWDYYLVRHVALFTKEERQELEEKLGKLYLRMSQNVRQCPRCFNFLFRDNNENRQVCPLCVNKGHRNAFCWACLKSWTGSIATFCGNQGCTGEDPRLKQLREAPMVKPTFLDGEVSVPGMRACPKCGALVIHASGCKHVVCYMQNCRCNFCFVCLKPQVNGGWQCGSHRTKCVPAPVQTSLQKSK